jgi:glycosyltransferase involved in cell wall biosynthesis
VLLARRSARRAPGGDVMQLVESAEVLTGAGWDARVAWTPDEARALLRGDDVLHLWNVQRTPDWGDLPAVARARGCKVVVTPLLHPVDRYHLQGRRGLDALAARVIRDADRFAALRRGRWDLARDAARQLAAADAVLLAHEAERGWLADWCGVSLPGAVVVPPAVPADPGGGSVASSPFARDFVLCVGRIEPLKNPMAVLRAAGRLRLPVAFVGGIPSARHLLHGRAFRRVARGPGARWLGELPATAVRALMRAARVHVLASWTEVLGRVSVEAALEGCAVVATDVGHAPDLLGRTTPGLFLAPPGDDSALTEALSAAWAHGRAEPTSPLRERARTLTWAAVAPALVAAYEALR